MEEELSLVVVVFPRFESLELSAELFPFALHCVHFEVVENSCLVVFLSVFSSQHSQSDLIVKVKRVSSPSIEATVELVEVFSPNKSLKLSFLGLKPLSVILPNGEIPGNFNFSVLFKVPM